MPEYALTIALILIVGIAALSMLGASNAVPLDTISNFIGGLGF